MSLISKHLLALLLLSFFIGGVAHAADDEPTEAYSTQELQQLLAPIALYPDTVLTHILIAATYPLEVIQADRWKQNHPKLTDEAAVNAGADEGWDPSVTALLAFPDLLSQMSEEIRWTQELGEAFLYNEADILSAIQALRQQAYDSGSLTDLEHLEVSQDSGNIVIAPIQREVVYIPYYDTRRVYGNWRWSSHPPVYWSHAYSNRYDRHGFYWGIHAPVASWFYFSGFHWGHRNVVVINSRDIYNNRGRHYSGSQLYTHHNASRWQHQPTHRRGVRYRDARAHRTWDSRALGVPRTRQQTERRETTVRRTTNNAEIARELRNPRSTRDESRNERNEDRSSRERRGTNDTPSRTNPAAIRNPSSQERSVTTTTTSTTRTRTVEPVLNGRVRESSSTTRRDDRSSSRNLRSLSTRTSGNTRTRESRTRER